MAWTNASLTTGIQNWMEYTASDFVANIPRIISNAENRIIRESNLRAFNFTATGTMTSGIDTITLPTSLVSIRELRLPTTAGVLEQRHETWLREYWPFASNQAEPKYYGLVDAVSLRLAPVPNTGYTYNLSFKAHPTGLAGSTDGTWLTNHADEVVLYACCYEAALYMRQFGIGDDTSARAQVDVWEARYKTALQALRLEHEGQGYREERDTGDR